MTRTELWVFRSGHLQLFSTENDSDNGQKTGQTVTANAFAQDIAEGLIALAAKDSTANLSPTGARTDRPDAGNGAIMGSDI